MANTKIEWADKVWNPMAGCSKVSAGCKNCYAERMAARLQAMGKVQYEGVVDRFGNWTGRVNYDMRKAASLDQMKNPKKIFVNSMSDLFHEAVDDQVLLDIWAEMISHPKHTFLILTKRPERALEFAKKYADTVQDSFQNVWMGVSVENQKTAESRIPYLLQFPARVRFVSCEPLLDPVNLENILWRKPGGENITSINALAGKIGFPLPFITVLEEDSNQRSKIHWVICGGESGAEARAMHPNEARALRDQCQANNVPFFFKQWGEWRVRVDKNGVETYDRPGKTKNGCLLDGREWKEFPA